MDVVFEPGALDVPWRTYALWVRQLQSLELQPDCGGRFKKPFANTWPYTGRIAVPFLEGRPEARPSTR